MRLDHVTAIASTAVGAIAGAASADTTPVGWSLGMALLAYVANEVRRHGRQLGQLDGRVRALEQPRRRRRK